MSTELTLKFMDGRIQKGLLSRPFKPSEKELEIIPNGKKDKSIFPTAVLCCLWTSELTPGQSRPGNELLDEVETTTDELFHVRIAGAANHPLGFWGELPQGDHFNKIFFFRHGVKQVRQRRMLGEILTEQGALSRNALTEILSEQEALKSRRIGDIISQGPNISREAIESTLQDKEKYQQLKGARVGEILISAGLITQQQLDEALSKQSSDKKIKLGELLIERGLINEEQLLSALATKFNMRFVDLEDITPSDQLLKVLPMQMIKELKVFPVEIKGNILVVATANPTNPMIYDYLTFNTERRIEIAVATSAQIESALKTHFEQGEQLLEEIIGQISDEVEIIDEEIDEAQYKETDSRVVRLVNNILIDAFNKGASDIHFEPAPGKLPMTVRYRIDGQCQKSHQVPGSFNKAVISRLKIMANLDIAERRKPQSGKIYLRSQNKKMEYRVEITPTVGSHEDAVLRILSSAKAIPLPSMGFSPQNLERFQEILKRPYGIILCVGPTGSGKTTSLHAALGHLNTPDRKIWTIEDPVEICQAGLRQVQVNRKIGLTFQEALRSFLRADPDVIMVGEMRDAETARIAIEASLTGHLVLSTLHTNNAPETVARLLEMGIEPYHFADALLGILAQRLVPKLCEACKEPVTADGKDLDLLETAYGQDLFRKDQFAELFHQKTACRKVGCEKCLGTGFKGRVAIHELMTASEPLKASIRKAPPASELRELALEEGMRTLRMDGVRKYLQGMIDLEYVLKFSA